MRALILSAALIALPAAAVAQDQERPPAGAEAGAHHGHRHADFESGRFHVRVEGTEGPHVVLIPGLTSAPEIWQPLLDRLDGPHRIHMVHVQGFAGAPAEDNATGPVSAPVAEDLARYIREQGLEDPIVIGHSMGGTIALMLAARHPDLVGKLMVVDQIPFMGQAFGNPDATPEMLRPMADMIRDGMISATPEAWRAQATGSIVQMVRTEPLREGPIRHSATSDQTVAGNAMHELILTDLRPELKNITVPTEVVYVMFAWPGMTPELTDQIYRGAYSGLTDATFTRVDDAAHFVMLDQPDVFAARVNAFID
ncbi:MAG: alpha/beta hydrolase [Alphaproteobacteria bacterium]|nr:alpha/beta hydrolase [Alphaproteobacteria bacterium]MBU1526495.1 alpha/beta hydrolase [Alphaproteobacteria bacterium]MBU2116459.1 alpha/beta hydrolase [Alphaproteobacteria bacterium]MBU2350287.1 alpha/beta hydrolase [Alphaproteobacteria bacterium]MBU2381267.1 alpha/beta hydrolase [Alphaproteobacteria bacterium]